ncbi:MAG: carbon-nitrogen hydrolase family protein [Granulosicoccus sp.]|nr:carbon-nitrogen hydrolase family protein [Granulosicoccus sp.]
MIQTDNEQTATKGPTHELGLSLLQHRPTPANFKASLARLNQAASDAVKQGSSLLITPECGMTGYDMSAHDAKTSAFPVDGTCAQQIAQVAKEHAIAIGYGFIEAADDQRFNSFQLINKHGNPVLHYRKTHLWGDLDRQLFSEGDRLSSVVVLEGWRIGVLICYDVEFPETVRALALAGAQLILVPTALMQPFRFVAEQMVPVRAAENQVYIAYANLVGSERDTIYEGCSTIAGPDGQRLISAPSDDSALLHTTICSEAIEHARLALPYHRDRRPELYDEIVKPT